MVSLIPGISKNGKIGSNLRQMRVCKAHHAPSIYVFQDKIWIAGGNTCPLVNDVWSLKLPRNWWSFILLVSVD
jgi:hypothetical protein